jgi:hypothetical protein
VSPAAADPARSARINRPATAAPRGSRKHSDGSQRCPGRRPILPGIGGQRTELPAFTMGPVQLIQLPAGIRTTTASRYRPFAASTGACAVLACAWLAAIGFTVPDFGPRGGPVMSRLLPGDGTGGFHRAVQPLGMASAGPAGVALTMAEEGIDIGQAVPKILTTGAVQESDVVITMGCGDTCPFFPGKRYEDWVLDDPSGQGIEMVRGVRDEIKKRVRDLIESLTPQAPPGQQE